MRSHLWRGLVALRSVEVWRHLARASLIFCVGLLPGLAQGSIFVFTFEFPTSAGPSNAGETGGISPSGDSFSENSLPAQLGTGPGSGSSFPGSSSLSQGKAASGAGGGLGGGGSSRSSGSGISSIPNAQHPADSSSIGGLNPAPDGFGSGASGGNGFDPFAGSPFAAEPTGLGGTSSLPFGNTPEDTPDQSGSLDTPAATLVTPEPFSLLIWTVLGLVFLAAAWWKGLALRDWSPVRKGQL